MLLNQSSRFLQVNLKCSTSAHTYSIYIFNTCRIQFLRHIYDFFEVIFKVEPQQVPEEDEELRTGGEKLVMTCVGVGYSNVSKAVS